MKTVILRQYNENLDTETEILLGECYGVNDFCRILNNHFNKYYFDTDGAYNNNRICVDDIEVITYEEYKIISEYIYECYDIANKLGLSSVFLAEQFLTNFGTNRLFQKMVLERGF